MTEMLQVASVAEPGVSRRVLLGAEAVAQAALDPGDLCGLRVPRHALHRDHGVHPARASGATASSPPSRSFLGEWPREMSSREAQVHYARSWLLVHYLIDFHLQEFLDFLVRVSAGKGWRSAWADEISLRFDGIDDALDRYHLRAKYGLWRVVARLPDMDAFVDSIAPAADVFALRSVLQANAPHPGRERSQKIEAAQRDLEAAFALDPGNARVGRIGAPVLDVAP